MQFLSSGNLGYHYSLLHTKTHRVQYTSHHLGMGQLDDGLLVVPTVKLHVVIIIDRLIRRSRDAVSVGG